MTTQTDIDLAKFFMPDIANKKDIVSTRKIKATAKSIAAAMEPERQALLNLVNRITEVQTDPSFKAVFKTAADHGVRFTGTPWKEELTAAQEIVNQWPVPDPTGE